MNRSKAVLWDMDGTLVDSEELHWIAWRDTMANEGIVITREQFLATFGQRNDSIIPSWRGSAPSSERIERIGQAKEELYRELVQRVGIAPEPGVAAWLDRLHKDGWQQAVASAAPRTNIDAVLALRVSRVFQGIVSAEDVKRGKPDLPPRTIHSDSAGDRKHPVPIGQDAPQLDRPEDPYRCDLSLCSASRHDAPLRSPLLRPPRQCTCR